MVPSITAVTKSMTALSVTGLPILTERMRSIVSSANAFRRLNVNLLRSDSTEASSLTETLYNKDYVK